MNKQLAMHTFTNLRCIKCIVLIAAFVQSPSCNQSEEVPTQSASLAVGFLAVQPEDLATDVGTMPARVLVAPSSRSLIPSESVNVLSDMVSAYTDTGPVPVRIERVRSYDGAEGEYLAGPTAIDITPVAGSWPDAWVTVEIEFDPLTWTPVGLAVSDQGKLAKGTWRFRPDSKPTLQRVDFCPGAEVLNVRFSLSEPVSRSDSRDSVAVSQGDALCVGVVDSDTDSTRYLGFTCPSPDLDGAVRIQLTDLRALSGEAVAVGRDAQALGTAVVPSTLPHLMQDPCTVLDF